MKKVLFVATVVKLHIMTFHIPYLEWFKKKGYEVHVAARNDYKNKKECSIPFCDRFFDLPFERSPIKKNNIYAFKGLKKIIYINGYDIIHCHTPVGGVLSRLAARKSRRNGTRVIYTVHGFHFFKGAHFKNWILYYPIEKVLSKYADILITLNREDYKIAINKNFRSKKIVLVDGVGINLEKFQPQSEFKKTALRDQYGYDANDFILIYAGALNYTKHQDLLINAAGRLKNRIPNLKILLAGDGKLEQQYKKQILDLDVDDQIELLGFRKDINNLMNLADVAVSAARREGLPVNVMEAMATGLPLVVTDCRGNRDLVTNNENGYVVGINDVDQFSDAIEKLYRSVVLRNRFREKNLLKIQKYSLDNVLKNMGSIYLGETEKTDSYGTVNF